MKFHLSILIIICAVFTACSGANQKNKIADGIYSKDDMVNILVELHLVEAAYRSGAVSDSANKNTKMVQSIVLERLGTDTLQFEESYNYYSSNSKKLEEIYLLVGEELTKRKIQSF